MPVARPTRADPEIAAATLRVHLDRLWASGRPAKLGWERANPCAMDQMNIVVKLPAKRADGKIDHYFIRLGAEYYDAAPPTVCFVHPEGWTPAPFPSSFFPVIEPKPSWFGLHHEHDFPGGSKGQLVCFSFAAEYYMTDHSPKESERWQQGRHTLAATLFRLAEVLSPPYYRGPSA